jgi:hypothetical protein
LTACDKGEPSITFSESDQSAIYSAVVRQIYIEGITFGGTHQLPALYIIRYTDDTASDPRAKPSESVLILETVQSEIVIALDDLAPDIIWVNSSAEMAKYSWGTLLDGGTIYVLKLIDGIWKITGTIGIIWVS